MVENIIYKAIIKECEQMEQEKVYRGNGHHLAQRLTGMIVKEMQLPDDEKDKEIESLKKQLSITQAYLDDFMGHSSELHLQGLLKDEQIIDFSQLIISQYKGGNTNIEQRALLTETLYSFKASKQQDEWEVVEWNGTRGANDFIPLKVIRKSDSAILEVDKEYEGVFMHLVEQKIKGKISSFFYSDNKLFLTFEGSDTAYNVDRFTSIVECKPVLLTTEDGEKIFDNERVLWCVYTDDGYGYSTYVAFKWSGFRGDYDEKKRLFRKIFSNKESAEAYISEHEPKYSLSMIREALLSIRGNTPAYVDETMRSLQLANLKTKQP